MFSLPKLLIKSSHSKSPVYRHKMLLKTEGKHTEDTAMRRCLALRHYQTGLCSIWSIQTQSETPCMGNISLRSTSLNFPFIWMSGSSLPITSHILHVMGPSSRVSQMHKQLPSSRKLLVLSSCGGLVQTARRPHKEIRLTVRVTGVALAPGQLPFSQPPH